MYINPAIGKIVGGCLMAVSLVFTVQLLTSFAVTGFDRIVYAVFGAGIQVCQTLMFLYFWLQGRHFGAVLFALLFCLSLVGSIGFFATNDATTLALSQNSDQRYKLMQSRSAQLEKQIGNAESRMSEYASKKYFTHGVKPTRELLTGLNAEQTKLHEQMLSFQAEPPSQALYSFLANFFVMPVDQVKLGLFTAYAVALDLCSVFLLAFSLSGGSGTGNPTRMSEPEVSNPQIAATTQVSKVGNVSPVLGTVQADPANPDKSMMLEYVEHLYPDTQKDDGSLIGRRKVSDLIGISNKQSDAVHRHLKSLGIVEVKGSKTFPKMSKAEALQAVGGTP